jgi:glycosyltransferase involved in cell wall biosynthesis
LKKLLFIVTKSEVGGAQKFILEQINVLSATNKYNFYIATDEKGWLIDNSSTSLQGTYLNNGIRSKLSFYYFINLFFYVKKIKPDLIICNSANAGFYGRIIAFLQQRKSVYYSHGWSSVYQGGNFSFILNRIEQFLSLISSKVICISQNDYNVAFNSIHIPPQKLSLISNSIIPPIVQIEKRHLLSLNKKILTIARFAKPKRVDLLIQSFLNLPDFELYVVGDGPDFNSLKDLVESLGLKNIFFLGEITNFNEWHEFDCFVLISDSEGLPMSCLEAMANGLPLVISNVGGCYELVDGNGYLVENNPHAISDAIKESHQGFSSLSAASLDLFSSKFDLNKNIYKVIDLYDSIIYA